MQDSFFLQFVARCILLPFRLGLGQLLVPGWNGTGKVGQASKQQLICALPLWD